MGITITGTGMALPAYCMDNNAMEELVDTANEWIVSRTGIETRYIAIEETGVDLAVAASRRACGWDAGGWNEIPADPEEIGLVIAATVSPDALVPSTAALIKREMNLPNAAAFDLNTACSGFVYAIWVAESLMKAGLSGTSNKISKALVVGVERLSRIVDWTDRGTCVLFGDGAGAALLNISPEQRGILGSYFKNYDDKDGALTVGMGYRPLPFGEDGPNTFPIEQYRDDPMKISMNGKKVFKFAVHAVVEVMTKVLEETGVDPDEVAYYVPHQANLRIIKAAAQRFHQPLEKFQVNMTRTGNSSAASVPMVLSELMESGKVKSGDKIMIVGFGGGLSAGAVLFEVPDHSGEVSLEPPLKGAKPKVSSGYLRAMMNESDRM